MANSATVGILRVLLTANTAEFDKAMQTAAASAQRFAKDAKAIGTQLQSVGTTLTTAITLPLVGLAGASVKAFSDFDDAMTKSTAIMGNLSREMRTNLETAARDVGKTTEFSAKQAADAFYFLASAGLTAKQSLGALPVVAKFAQAGNFDLAQATSLLANAQSALGLRSEDTATHMRNMVRVSDVLVKANILADGSTQQFSEALTNKAAPALRLVHKDIEEGVAVLAVYADQGVKGAEAGEKLNIVLRDLQTQAIKHKKAFAELGVSVFDAQGKMRNMADIVADLERALAGMSDEQRKATIMTLGFQDKSVSALNALIGLSGQIRTYESALRSAGGVTEDVAKRQLESFKAQLTLLWHRITDVGIALGEALMPVLKTVVAVISGSVPIIEAFVKGFTALPMPIQAVALGLGGLLAAAGPALVLFGQMATGAGTLVGAFTKAGIGTRALAGLFGPAAQESTALTQMITAMGGAATTTAGSTGLLASAIGLLTNPITLAAGAAGLMGLAIYKVATAETELEKSLRLGGDAFKATTETLARALDTYRELAHKQGLTKDETIRLDAATRTLADASGLSSEAFKREEAKSNDLTDALVRQVRARKELYAAAINQARSAAADAAQALADAQKRLNDVLKGQAQTIDAAMGPGAQPVRRGMTAAERVQEIERLNAQIAGLKKTAEETSAAFQHMADVRPFKDVDLDAQGAATNLKKTGQAAADATKDLAALRAEINGVREAGNLDRLTEQLRSGAYSVKQLSTEFGISQEAVKLYKKELGLASAEHKVAEQAANAQREALEKLDAELAGKGILTITGYSTKLGELVEILNAAAASGTGPLQAALAVLTPEFEKLSAAAKLSGQDVTILAGILNDFGSKAGIPQIVTGMAAWETANLDTSTSLDDIIGKLPTVSVAAEGTALSAEMMTDAFHEFGLKTPQELQKAADAARFAYQQIVATVGKNAPAAIEAHRKMVEAINAQTGRIPSYWKTNIFPGIRDVIGHIQTAVSGSFAQMLLGAKSFKDGFLDVWKSIKAGILQILASIADAFINSFLKGLLGALTGQKDAFSQAFAGLFGGAGKGLLGGLLGGGGAAAGGVAVGGSTGGLLGAGGASTTGGLLGAGTTGGTAAGGGAAAGGTGGAAGAGSVLAGGAASAGSGVLLGMLGKQLFGGAGWKAGTFGAASGAASGAAIGTYVFPGIGTALGAVIGGLAGLISGWLGKTQAMKVNDARDQVIGQFGPSGTGAGSGFAVLAGELAKITGGGDIFHALIKASNFKDFEAAVKRVQAALESTEYATVKVREATEQLTAEREQLTASGESEDAVIRQQAASYSTLFQTIAATGAAVPASLEPILQTLVDMGLLVDATGQKVTDLSKAFPAIGQAAAVGADRAENEFTHLGTVAEEQAAKARAALASIGKNIPPISLHYRYSQEGPGLPRDWPGGTPLDGSAPTIPGTQSLTGGLPDGADVRGMSIPAHRLGGVFDRPHVGLIAEGGQAEIIGSVGFMTKALEGALARNDAAASVVVLPVLIRGDATSSDLDAIIANLKRVARRISGNDAAGVRTALRDALGVR